MDGRSTTTLTWLILAGAIGLEVAATLSMRASDGFKNAWWLAPIIIGYGGAFFLLAQVLRLGMPVGAAYGIWSGVGVALTTLLGYLVFRDPLTGRMMAGAALVIAGVVLLESAHANA